MQPPKRQIIKTRPQRPYVVARYILAIVVLLALTLAAFEFFKSHQGHALGVPGPFFMRQEASGIAHEWRPSITNISKLV